MEPRLSLTDVLHQGEVLLERLGDLETTMSAPWSVRALAFSRNVSLWHSICFLDLSAEALNFPLVTTTHSGRSRPYSILPHFTVCLGRCHISILRGLSQQHCLFAPLRLHRASCWHVSDVVQRAHFRLRLLLEVQLLVLDFDIASPWLVFYIRFRATL